MGRKVAHTTLSGPSVYPDESQIVPEKFTYDNLRLAGNNNRMTRLLALFLLLPTVCPADELFRFGPAIADQLILEEDFSKANPKLDKALYQNRQGTRWEIVEGVLRGIPSSAEYQENKSHHRGFEPRLSFPTTPEECIAHFSIRFLEGEETAIVPFIEFGHHIVRLRFSETEGVSLLVDYESIKVAEDKAYRYPKGEWLEVTAALKEDEFLISIADGPELFAKHPVIRNQAPSGGTGLGVAGPKGGTVEFDNLKLWTIQPQSPPEWKNQRKALPVFEPVQVREKPRK